MLLAVEYVRESQRREYVESRALAHRGLGSTFVVTAFVVLLCLAAVLAWVNERFIKIPTTVGVTLAGAVASILLIVLDVFGWTFGLKAQAQTLLETLDFTSFVLNGILSVLLFAGALSLDARQLWAQRASILTLASVSTIISTILIGLVAWATFRLVGLEVPLVGALLFGALISCLLYTSPSPRD